MIAVLVNAALLIGLFVTAIKRDDVTKEKTVAEVKKIDLPTQSRQEIKTAQGDEIDQVIKEFSKKTEVAKNEKGAAPQKIDFAKELEAITKASSPVQTKTVAPSKGTTEVRVRKGDALEKIARAHHTSVNEIVQLNQLKTTTLQIGQTLKIPSSSTQGGQRREVASTSEEFYVVKSGDNPWSIAVKNHLKLEELLKINNLDEQKARRLKPGDKLRIK